MVFLFPRVAFAWRAFATLAAASFVVMLFLAGDLLTLGRKGD
jgi:hypothetical protein